MANQNKRTILKSKLNNLHQANGTETPYIGVPFAGNRPTLVKTMHLVTPNSGNSSKLCASHQ